MFSKDNPFFRRIKKFIFAFIILVPVLGYNIYLQTTSPFSPSFEDNKQFFLLIQINNVLITILVAVLARQLVKIIYERRQKVLGSKIKSKLVLAFLVLAIVPVILFFYVTNDYISSTVGQWFVPKTNNTIDESINLLKIAEQRQENFFTNEIINLTTRLKLFTSSGDYKEIIKNVSLAQPINGIGLYNSAGELVERIIVTKNITTPWQALSPQDLTSLNFIDDQEVIAIKPIKAIKSSEIGEASDQTGLRKLVAKFNNNLGQTYYVEVYQDISTLASSDLAKNLAELTALQESLKSSRLIAFNHRVLLIWISIIMLFAFTWFAIYISRTIITPLERLLYGMQKVTKGDWKVRLSTDVARSDELKQALHTFNKMTIELDNKSRQIVAHRQLLLATNENLTQKNQILERIFKRMSIGSSTIDSNGYLLEVNQSFRTFFHLTEQDFNAQPIKYQAVLPSPIANIISKLIKKITTRATTYAKLDFKSLDLDKEVHYKFEIYQIIDDESNDICQLVLVHDLTEIDKLMHAKAWQDVARRLAHEIKNPLTPIRISAERLQKKYYDKNPTSYQSLFEMTNTIVNEVDIIKKMVNEFSDFARMPLINLKLLSVDQAIKAIALSYEHHMPEGVKLIVKSSLGDVNILIDEYQIKQALHNLIQNSLNALQETKKGQINIKTSINNELGLVIISVIDNGSGISKNLIGNIFEPYITTSSQGTGLGLAIVQKIIHDHQGIIKVSSKPNQQTVFSIELPVAS